MVLICISIMLICNGDQSKPSEQIKGSYEYYERVAREYYSEYKEDLFCSEQEFVDTFIMVINDGGDEEDGRLWAFLLNMKIIGSGIVN